MNNNNRRVILTTRQEVRARDLRPVLRIRVLAAHFKRSPSYWVARIRKMEVSVGVKRELALLLKETMTWAKSKASIDAFIKSLDQHGR
jgi:hypothetical protein